MINVQFISKTQSHWTRWMVMQRQFEAVYKIKQLKLVPKYEKYGEMLFIIARLNSSRSLTKQFINICKINLFLAKSMRKNIFKDYGLGWK